MATSFSIGDSLSYGWTVMKKNFVLFLYILLTYIGLQIIWTFGMETAADALIGIIFMLFVMILKLGFIRITLDLHDGKRVSYKQLISQPNLFPDYLIATILYVLIILGGLILLIVPGIIWAIKFSLYDYYIVDKRMGPIEALKRSAKATYGHKWNLFLFFLAVIGINIVGLLALVVGLFATIPTSEMAMVWMYRNIESEYAKADGAAKKTAVRKAPVRAKKKR